MGLFSSPDKSKRKLSTVHQNHSEKSFEKSGLTPPKASVNWNLYIRRLALGNITLEKIKNVDFINQFQILIKESRHNKYLVILLAHTLCKIDDPAVLDALFEKKELTDYFYQDLIFRLFSAFERIISDEKNKYIQEKEVVKQKEGQLQQVSEGIKSDKTEIEDNNNNNNNQNLLSTLVDNQKKSILQKNAEQCLTKLQKILWFKDILGTTLNISHTKGRFEELRCVLMQNYIIRKEYETNQFYNKESKQALINAILKIAKTYIIHAAQESHPGNIKGIPIGVKRATIVRINAILEEYYSSPKPKELVPPLNFSLTDEEDGTVYDFKVPISIGIKFWIALNIDQLDHGIVEEANLFIKNPNSNEIFHNEQLKEDLQKLMVSDKILLQGVLQLDPGQQKVALEHLPTIYSKSAKRNAEKITMLRREEANGQLTLLNDIRNFIIDWREGKRDKQELFGYLKLTSYKLEKLSKRSNEEQELLKQILELLSVNNLVEHELKIIPGLEKLTAEINLYEQSEKLVQTEEVFDTPEQLSNALIVSVCKPYKTKVKANEYRARLNNPNFRKLINTIPYISLIKYLSTNDKQIIKRTLQIDLVALTNPKLFSNNKFGEALYQVFLKSVITDDFLVCFENCLNSRNLASFNDLKNKKLAGKITTAVAGVKIKILRKIFNYIKEGKFDELLKIKHQPVGVKVFQALYTSISFPFAQAQAFIQCIQEQNIDAISEISPLGPQLRKAVSQARHIPEIDINIIIASLRNYQLEKLEECITSGLGKKLRDAILQSVGPTENDKKLIRKAILELKQLGEDARNKISILRNKYPNHEFVKRYDIELTKNKSSIDYYTLQSIINTVDANRANNNQEYCALKNELDHINKKTKQKILRILKSYSNTKFCNQLEDILYDDATQYLALDRGKLLHILKKLEEYQNIEEELLKCGDLGNIIYCKTIVETACESFINPEFMSSLEKYLRTGEKTSQIPQYLIDIFDTVISCTNTDCMLIERIFGDRFQDFKTMDSAELGEIFYKIFNEYQPILSIKERKKFYEAWCKYDLKILTGISNEQFVKQLQSKFIIQKDLVKIGKIPFTGKVEKYKKISNLEFGELLFKALEDLNLGSIFVFNIKEKSICFGINILHTDIINAFLDLGEKNDNKEEPFFSVDQLPAMIEGMISQPDENLMRTLHGLFFDLPLDDRIRSYFFKNVFQQLSEKLTSPNQVYFSKLEKLLYSTTFLAETLAVAEKHFTNETIDKHLMTALGSKLANLQGIFPKINALFESKDFIETFNHFWPKIAEPLVELTRTDIIYNEYQSFVSLILYSSYPPNEKDFLIFNEFYKKIARIALEAFTFMALTALSLPKEQWPSLQQAKWDDLPKNGWPNFLVDEKDPFMQELILIVGRLSFDTINGYDNQGNVEEKTLMEVLKDLFLRMSGLSEGVLSKQNPLHRSLLKYCNVGSSNNITDDPNNNNCKVIAPPKPIAFSKSVNINKGLLSLSSQITAITVDYLDNLSSEADAAEIHEHLAFSLQIAVDAGDRDSAATLINYCFRLQILDADFIKEVFSDHIRKIDIENLIINIEKERKQQIDEILKTAGKFDLTACACLSNKEQNPLIVAFKIENKKSDENEKKFNIFLKLIDYFVKEKEPFCILQFFSNTFDLPIFLDNVITTALKDIGYNKIHKKYQEQLKNNSSTHETGSGAESTSSPSSPKKSSGWTYATSSDEASTGQEEVSSSSFTPNKNSSEHLTKSHSKSNMAVVNTEQQTNKLLVEDFQKLIKNADSKGTDEKRTIITNLLRSDPTATFLNNYINQLIESKQLSAENLKKRKQELEQITKKLSETENNWNEADAQKMQAINSEYAQLEQCQQKTILQIHGKAKKAYSLILTTIKSINDLEIKFIFMELLQKAIKLDIFDTQTEGVVSGFIVSHGNEILPKIFEDKSSLTSAQGKKIISIAYHLNSTFVIEQLKNQIKSSHNITLTALIKHLVSNLDVNNKQKVIAQLLPVMKAEKHNKNFGELMKHFENIQANVLSINNNIFNENNEKLSKEELENKINTTLHQMFIGGDTQISITTVNRLFKMDAELTVSSLRKYTKNIFYSSYEASPSAIIDFLIQVWNERIRYGKDKQLVIGQFIDDLNKATNIESPIGSGNKELIERIKTKILEPYELDFGKNAISNIPRPTT